VVPLSGALAEQGRDMVDAAELAVTMVNDAGGIAGRPLVLRVEDDLSSTAGAASAATVMADAGVSALVGSVGTPLSRAVAEVAAVRGLPLVASSATSLGFRANSEAASESWPVLRTCTGEEVIPDGVASLATDDGVGSIAIIVDPGGYGVSMGDAIAASASAAGLTVIAPVTRTNADEDAGLLTRVLDQGAESVALVLDPEAGASLIQMMATQFSDRLVPFYFTETLATEAFVAQAGTESLNTVAHHGVRFADQGRWYPGFASLYEGTYGAAPRPFQAQTFDAVILLALGLAAQEVDPAAALWSSVLSASRGGESLTAGLLEVAFARVAAGIDVDYDGASGAVDMTAVGDVDTPLARWRVVDGVLTVTSPP